MLGVSIAFHRVRQSFLPFPSTLMCLAFSLIAPEQHLWIGKLLLSTLSKVIFLQVLFISHPIPTFMSNLLSYLSNICDNNLTIPSMHLEQSLDLSYDSIFLLNRINFTDEVVSTMRNSNFTSLSMTLLSPLWAT